jgi:hypothetical protein
VQDQSSELRDLCNLLGERGAYCSGLGGLFRSKGCVKVVSEMGILLQSLVLWRHPWGMGYHMGAAELESLFSGSWAMPLTSLGL